MSHGFIEQAKGKICMKQILGERTDFSIKEFVTRYNDTEGMGL